VRWAQVAVSLLSVWLLYLVGCRVFDRRIALLAAAGLAVYPSLLFSGILLLTETLFVLLLLLFVYCLLELDRRPSASMALATGAVLALCALTRSVMWPFILVLVALAWLGLRADRRTRATVIAGLLAGYALVISPWAARNTALQGTLTVVDTMGGLNLYMGNYEYTPEDRMWDAVSLTGDRYWAASLPPHGPDGQPWTEGRKDKWAQRQALTYMAAHPWTTLRRSVLKLADFWGLERDFVAGVQRGYYSPPAWALGVGAVATTLGYILTAVLAAVGIWLAPPPWRAHALLLLVVGFIAGVHAVVFGHSRYHLPLVPILLLYAASAFSARRWRDLLTGRPALLAAATIALLVVVWSREIVVRDWDRIRALVAG
jgi:4-amino-4-deoxy-L-arabinose transferase-like glycosyltransferase